MRIQSINCDKYFMLCIDYYFIIIWEQFLKHNSKVFDRGGEFISDEFTKYYEKYDMRRQL